MFTEQLNFFKTINKSQPSNSTSNNSISQIFQADIQYQIYGTFMKHLGQKLSIRQSQLMEESKKFIDHYSNLKIKEIDSSRTLDTFADDGIEPSQTLDEDRSLGLNRRNLNHVNSRKNLQQFSSQLSEIQRHCSYSCYNFFSILVAEYKKMQNKLKNLESKQILMIRTEEEKYKNHEENIILKKRLQHQKERMEHLEAEIQVLKEKNKSINYCINEKINSISANYKYFEINQKVYKDIKNYMLQKENALRLQYEKIDETERNVLKAIQQAFKDYTCGKCCEILRKLKESIIKYKKYLQGESLQFQKLYDKYKKTMYSLKSRHSL